MADGHDVFISYSRADGDFVQRLQDALSARGRRAWVDWQDIAPTAEWMDEIRRAMDAADAVVFVLSPDSLGSKVCGEELDHAIASNKKIVPILARAVDATSAPEAVARLNWIDAEGGSLDTATDRLVEAVDTDLDRVRAHSRLLARSREWVNKDEDNALLLRGSELSDAEALIGTDAEPRPTPDQTRIVLASRRAASKRQRSAVSLVTAAFVVAAALGVFAWTQRGTAIEQRQEAQKQTAIANSRALGAAAISNLDQQPDLAALLSLEALGSAPTTESAQAIHTTAQTTSWVRRVMWGDSRDPIFAVAFSPDGSMLASGSTDGTIDLWNPETGERIGAPLEGHQQVQTLAFSPDGDLLASGGDGKVILWDPLTGTPVGEPLRFGSTTYTLAFGPDGGTLAVGLGDGTIRLWDVGAGAPIGKPVHADLGDIWSVAISPDGRSLAGSGSDGLRLWDVGTGKPIGEPLIRGTLVTKIDFSPDGDALASGEDGGVVHFWDPATGREVGKPLHVGPVLGLSFSPDGRVLATGSETGGVRSWDATTHAPIGGRLAGQVGGTRSLAFSPDGRMLASGSDTGNVTVWGRVGVHSAVKYNDVFAVEYSPDGSVLATAGGDGSVGLWDAATWAPIGAPLRGSAYVNTMAFRPDGRVLAVGYGDGTAELWDPRAGTQIGKPLHGPLEGEVAVAFSPDGNTLATGSYAHAVILWDPSSGKQIGDPLTGHTGKVQRIAFSQDGTMLAASSQDGTVILWDPKTGEQIGDPLEGPISSGADVAGLAFSPDGSTLAAGYTGGSIRLWNPSTGDVKGISLKLPLSEINVLEFSPDSATLASGSIDGSIALWNVRTGQQIGGLMAGYGAVWGLDFSPDGRYLASGGSNGSTYLRDQSAWSADPALLRDRLCLVAGRNMTRAEWARFLPFAPYRATCPEYPTPAVG